MDTTPPPGAQSDYPLGVNPEPPPGKVILATDQPKGLAFPSTAAGSLLPARVRLIESSEGKYRTLRIQEVWADRARTQLIARHTMVGDHLMVSPADGVDAARLRLSLPDNFTIRRTLRSGGALLVSFPVVNDDSLPAARAALEKLRPTLVKRVEPDTFVHTAAIPNDPLFPEQWGLHNTGQNGGTPDADIDAPEAWDLRTDATAFPIAVIDTGIDSTHPDLDANIWTNTGETGTDAVGQDKRTNGVDDDANGYIDDWRGWDFANDDNDPMDDNGHGTQIAGIIGAEGNNGEGITGVCWSCRMMPLKALTSTGSGAWSDVIDAVAYAKSMKARVGNLSFGAYGAAPEEVKSTFAAANETLWCAAAGNGELPPNGNQTGDNLDEFHFFPACLDIGHLVSVTATARNDQLATFANYGHFMVDIAAPGVGIQSTLANGGYGLSSGTSMSCAYVSGFCALAHPLRIDPYPLNIRQLVLTTVKRSEGLRNKLVTRGRLDASLFLAQAKAKMEWQMFAPGNLQIRPDGVVMQWGNAATNPADAPFPKEVPLPADARSVHHQNRTFYALLSDGTLWSWKAETPPHAMAITDVWFLPTGNTALKTDGSVWTWWDESEPPELLSFDRPIVQSTGDTFLDDQGRLYDIKVLDDDSWIIVHVTGYPPLDRFTYIPPYENDDKGRITEAFLARTVNGEAYGHGNKWSLGLPSDPQASPDTAPVRLPKWDGYLRAWGSMSALYASMPDGKLLSSLRGTSEGGPPYEISGVTHLIDLDVHGNVAYTLDRSGRFSEWEWESIGFPHSAISLRPLTQLHDIVAMWDQNDYISVNDYSRVGRTFLNADFQGIFYGSNTEGLAGIGTQSRKYRPVELTAIHGAKDLLVSSPYNNYAATAAILPGAVHIWGWIDLEQVLSSPSIRPTPAGYTVKHYGNMGEDLIMEDGTFWRWNWSPTQPRYVKRSLPSPAVSFSGGLNVVVADGRILWITQSGYTDITTWQNNEFIAAAGSHVWGEQDGVRLAGSYALKKDGTVWKHFKGIYTQVSGLFDVTQISGNPTASFALRNDGHVFALGSGVEWPALGNGQLSWDSPTMIEGLTNIIQIAAGESHAVALRADGEIFTWGLNSAGQLGVGDNLPRNTLQQPYGLAGVVRIWAEGLNTFAQRTDSSIWGWGANRSGELCDGSAVIEGAPNLAYGSSGTVFNSGNGFTDWLTTNFNEQELRDIELFGDVKDPDDDGLSNLLEYALGTNPRKYTAANSDPYEPVPDPTVLQEYTNYMPTVRLEKVRRNYYTRGVGIAGDGEPDDETTHLVMTVPRAARRSDVDYIIEVSDDMEHWHFGPGHTVEVLNTLTSLVAYDARPLEENPTRYIRLRLVRNNPGQTSIPR